MSRYGGGGNGGGGGGGNINQPPYFVHFNPPLTATSGRLYTYEVGAIDPDNDPVTFRFVQAPQGMFIAASSGLIFWMPTTAELGSHRVIVEVSDGTHATQASYSVVVQSEALGPPLGGPTVPSQTIPPSGNSPPRGGIPNIQSVSISTTTETSVERSDSAGNENKPTALLALVLNFLNGIRDWLGAHYCGLGYLLWFLTLAAFVIYYFWSRRSKKEVKKMNQ